VALAVSEVRRIVEQACARQDVLDTCARRDLGTVVAILGSHGLTQGQIGSLTGSRRTPAVTQGTAARTEPAHVSGLPVAPI
jgi:hypothetical protein